MRYRKTGGYVDGYDNSVSCIECTGYESFSERGNVIIISAVIVNRHTKCCRTVVKVQSLLDVPFTPHARTEWKNEKRTETKKLSSDRAVTHTRTLGITCT